MELAEYDDTPTIREETQDYVPLKTAREQSLVSIEDETGDKLVKIYMPRILHEYYASSDSTMLLLYTFGRTNTDENDQGYART